MKTFSVQFLFLILLLSGCTTTPKNFKLIFTMESIKVYKASIELNSDKSYQILQQNLFFDAHAGEERVNKTEGKLTDEEFDELTKRIADSRLFKMKNVYGFNKKESNNDPLEGLLYRLDYTEENKIKYILIHPNPADAYPKGVSQLINFLSNCIAEHSKK